MSRDKPKKDVEFSVSRVMKLVSWDYLPNDTDQPLDAPAGSFLQDIPWDSPAPRGRAKDKKDSSSED